ncbi:MAG: hypothetical protein JEY91_07975 [Spirochaetaceae bacterium]|nr:hypothetical protein [Spirochaetaceae bacterium]
MKFSILKEPNSYALIGVFILLFIIMGCEHENGSTLLYTDIVTQTIKDSSYNCTYSFVTDPQKDKASILIYLHGAGGDSKSIFKSNPDEINELLNHPDGPSTIISISFGPYWLLTFNKLPDTETLHIPVSIFHRLISQEIIPPFSDTDSKVMIMGHSMGGHNAAQAAFRYPETYHKVLILSPSYLPISPFASINVKKEFALKAEMKYGSLKSRVKQMITGTGYIEDRVLDIFEKQKAKYITEQNWNNQDFIPLLERPNIIYPETYISCGINDPFALMEGSLSLYNKLIEIQNPVTFDPLKGGHNVFNWPYIINFITDNQTAPVVR